MMFNNLFYNRQPKSCPGCARFMSSLASIESFK